jgi:hypothetical protein
MSAYDGPNPGMKLIEIKRLDDVVVRASVETGYPAVQMVARRNDHHGRGVAPLAQSPEDLQTALIGQPEIEKEEAVFGITQSRQAIRTTIDPINRHSGAGERAIEAPGNHPIVLDKKNAHRSILAK